MEGPQLAEYGSWRSPITSDVVSSGTLRLTSPVVMEGGTVYWVEGRPSEGGRSVVVRRTQGGERTDLNLAPFDVRTRVHEYGGGSYLVHDGILFFSNFADQRLYRLDPGEGPRPITPESDSRYADGVYDPTRRRIICVSENHREGGLQPVNSIAAVDARGDGDPEILVSGNDFYASPRISDDGTRLAWVSWNHPDMPWDGTELWLGELDGGGAVVDRLKVAGGRQESVCQPRFSPEGVLYFVSDRSGWWNLYRWTGGEIEPLWEMEAEFAEPAWVFGLSNYDFVSSHRIVCAYTKDGTSHLASIRLSDKGVDGIEVPYTSIGSITAGAGGVAFLGGSPTEAMSLVHLALASGETPGAFAGSTRVLARSTEGRFEEEYVSSPRHIEFPTERGLTAHALYYPPRNQDFAAPSGDRPPLMVISHGGPTSAASSVLNLSLQYWTSRGFAVVDVDYGGSSGYGREYRKRLEGRWGIVDVEDCVRAASYLVDRGLADPGRLAIRGGSAGGYTTLAALAFRDLFKAGASYYGVSDLEALTKDTHKFESRYLEGLIGPYPGRRDLYLQRSPIHHIDGLSCPIIFFQGDEDRVVPPNQAERMADALRKKGVPVAYLLFKGEQHGFRRWQNIKRALDAELYFYSRIFGFGLPDPAEPVEIANLEDSA